MMETLDCAGSSNMEGAEYDPSDQTLVVTFKSGRQYEFFGVEQEIWDLWQTASSKGRYFNDVIKRGGYVYGEL